MANSPLNCDQSSLTAISGGVPAPAFILLLAAAAEVVGLVGPLLPPPSPLPRLRKCEMKSMGRGKMMVEFFSAEIEFSVCEMEGDTLSYARSIVIALRGRCLRK